MRLEQKILVLGFFAAVFAIGALLFLGSESEPIDVSNETEPPVLPVENPAESVEGSFEPAVCGNNVVEFGEDCESCPEDLGEECTACNTFKEGKIKASFGKEFYLCVGQSVEFFDHDIALSIKNGSKTFFLTGFNGLTETKVLQEPGQVSFGFLFFKVKKILPGGVLLKVGEEPQEVFVGESFKVSPGSYYSFPEENIFIAFAENPENGTMNVFAWKDGYSKVFSLKQYESTVFYDYLVSLESIDSQYTLKLSQLPPGGVS
jgi:hypothetical protein